MRSFYSSLAVVSTSIVLVGACTSASSSASSSSGGGGEGGAGGSGDLVVGGARPVTVHVPPGLDPAKPSPLVILLHGFGASGYVQELVFQLQPESEKRGFLYAYPDGTPDQDKKRFWNATDACCDFYGTGVDDSAYLASLVDEIGQHYAVDPKRIYFLGHSNGGYMSHRMACDHSDKIAAIASLAGAVYADPTKCKAEQPISVLQIHGTEDDAVLYEGGTSPAASYPSAMQTTEIWAQKNGCAAMPEMGAPLDIDELLAGAETKVTKYATGCKAGGAAELWTIEGGTHIPGLGKNFAPTLVDWLFAHPKP